LNQNNNSIIFNADISSLNSASSDSLYIKPIRLVSGTTSGSLNWNSTSGEIIQYSGKTFVINHPTKTQNHLVHSCLEGPEQGVYYRGTSVIKNKYVKISIPFLLNKNNLNIIVTPILDINKNFTSQKDIFLFHKMIKNDLYIFSNKPTSINFLILYSRKPINVCPLKEHVKIKGKGSYLYI